jgi:hypothetical protein
VHERNRRAVDHSPHRRSRLYAPVSTGLGSPGRLGQPLLSGSEAKPRDTSRSRYSAGTARLGRSSVVSGSGNPSCAIRPNHRRATSDRCAHSHGRVECVANAASTRSPRDRCGPRRAGSGGQGRGGGRDGAVGVGRLLDGQRNEVSCAPTATRPVTSYKAARPPADPVPGPTGSRCTATSNSSSGTLQPLLSQACDLGSVGHYASDGVMELSVFKV